LAHTGLVRRRKDFPPEWDIPKKEGGAGVCSHRYWAAKGKKRRKKRGLAVGRSLREKKRGPMGYNSSSTTAGKGERKEKKNLPECGQEEGREERPIGIQPRSSQRGKKEGGEGTDRAIRGGEGKQAVPRA